MSTHSSEAYIVIVSQGSELIYIGIAYRGTFIIMEFS